MSFEANENTFSEENDLSRNDSNFSKQLQDEWLTVCEYYPTLDKYYQEILSVNKKIAFIFQAIIIDQKKFNNAKKIKNQLINKFLMKHFGTNKNIHNYVLLALKSYMRSKENQKGGSSMHQIVLIFFLYYKL